MVGNGTEKLEKYTRTGNSKKAATSAAAEAIALSGHCVGFIRSPFHRIPLTNLGNPSTFVAISEARGA